MRFVHRQRAVGCPVRVGKELGRPIGVVAAEKPQADACVARLNHVGSHLLRPVLVVTDGEVCLTPEQATDVFVRINVGDIGNVVSFLFEPSDHTEFHCCGRHVVEKIPGSDSVKRTRGRIAGVGPVQ